MRVQHVSATIDADVRAVRHGVGAWLRTTHTFIRFEGRDVASWLQTQTTNDVVALQSGEGHAGALLDRKGRLQSHFTLHRWEDEYWLIVEAQQAESLLAQLDAHLFIEDVRMENAGSETEQIVVQGPRALYFLHSQLDDKFGVHTLPQEPYSCRPIEVLGRQALAFAISETGEDGFVLVTAAGEARALLDALLEAGAAFGIREIGAEAQNVLRIEAGIPRFGVDMDTNNRLPETTLERSAVSYTKGCYLGQEVIAKLRAYSSVKQTLVGLALRNGQFPPFGSRLVRDGTDIGVIRSVAHSPTLQEDLALAYLDRGHRAPGTRIELRGGEDGQPFEAEVRVLPFYTAESRDSRAQALYDRALTLFERDTHDEDDTAIELLREAVLLAPRFEDAYEALGVILNRHHRVDEAIHYMKILAQLNPDSVMAHTNLSVFYVAKGMITEAEEEKAKAAVLQMKQARSAREAEELAAKERERIRADALERIAMFREVLEIDPEDPLATFGTGMAYLQLNEFEQAVPYFKRATEIQKDYSVAWLNLGKCYEFLSRADDARAAYQAGIESAARKGDLMPLREMERRLRSLPS